MRRIHWLLAGLALAIGAGALAQVVPGGLPARPTFQSITSTGTGGAGGTPSYLAKAAIPSYQWTAPANGTDQKSIQCYWNGAALQYNCTFVNDAGSAEHTFLSVTRGTGTVVTNVSLGNATDNANINMNGFRLPTFSFGEFIATAGGCSNNSGVWQTQNLGGTCTRNSAGVYTINFTTAYHGSPICFAGPTSVAAGVAGVNTAGTTSVTVSTASTAFAVTDIGSFFVSCMGF